MLIAAGSGITPMISIAASVLAADSKSSVTLLYGNRRSETVVFADDVADLKPALPPGAAHATAQLRLRDCVGRYVVALAHADATTQMLS